MRAFSAFFFLAVSAAASPTFAAEAEPRHADSNASPAGTPAAARASSFPKTALQVGVGPTGIASTWRGDAGAGGSARLGILLFGALAPDVLTRLTYSTVDDRMLTYLSVGATGYVPLRVVRPYGRFAFVHQHEESRAAIENDFGSAALGVGPGIRHRAGVAGSLGAETPVGTQGKSTFTFGGDVTATHFPDPRGPATYFGGTLWVTLHHAL